MTEPSEKIRERALTAYERDVAVRAAVQAIPWVGTVLDTLFSVEASRIRDKRAQEFLRSLSERLERVEHKPRVDQEELFDLVIDAIERAVRTRSAEKRAQFAAIVANRMEGDLEADQASMAMRIISELDALHLAILSIAIRAPDGPPPFSGIAICFVEAPEDAGSAESFDVPILTKIFSDHPTAVVRLAVAELIARGLLHDEGVNRWDSGAMEYVRVTESAKWLCARLD